MSLTTTIAVQDGASAAAVNLTAGQAFNVTPGNLLVVIPQVTTGMLSWTVVIKSDYGPINGTSQTFTGPLFQFNLPLPQQPCTITVFSEATDGNNFYQTQNTLYCFARTGVTTHSANWVITANVNLANANVSADSVQVSQGDVVLCVGQSNTAANGPYVVGAVTANIAALTRPPDYATGQVLKLPQVWEIAEGGTSWGGSTWKITLPTGRTRATSGAVTVDTTPTFLFPRVRRGSIANAATANAAANVVGLFLYSNTSTVLVQANVGNIANNYCYCTANVGANSTVANSGYFTIATSATTGASAVYVATNW